MNSTSSKVIIAVVAAALGLGAVAPAMAQTAPQAPETAVTQPENGQAFRPHGEGPRHRGGGEGAGFLDFGRGTEAVEIALVQLSHRIDLTTEQQGLLDTLKTSALAAAGDFATATEGLRPTPPAEGAEKVIPSVAERLENRIAVEKAHVAALEAVQPAVVAFFDSLTDEQKAELAPQPGERGPGPRGQHDGKPQGPRGFGGNR